MRLALEGVRYIMRLVPGGTSRHRSLYMTGALALTCILAVAPALAQGWPWNNWGSQPQQQQRPPEPRDQVYRGPSGGNILPPQAQGRSAICLQLEQRLAQEANRGVQSRDILPRIEQDIRVADRQFQMAQSQLERADCYEYFLFSKSLRRTKRCVDLNAQAESAGRRLSELNAQRQQLMSSDSRSYQEDIVRELARNNCGASYQQQAKQYNPFSSIWQDEDSGNTLNGQYGNLPFATFRTVCVRLCDGYYFPVSYSTLPNHFDRDAQVCESQCAAPAELFYHQNPGADMAQAVSHRTRQPYNALKAAFRYRKEFVQGCSCKQAEYAPDATHSDRRADVPAPTRAASRQ